MFTLNEEDVSRLDLPGRTCKVLVGNEKLAAENLTFGVTEVDATSKMTPHKHEQEEVIFILRGHGRVTINDKPEEIKEGTVIYLPSNSEHAIENESSETMKFTFAFSPTIKVGSYG